MMLVAALPTVCGCAGGDPNGSDINTPAHVSGQGITCSLPGVIVRLYRVDLSKTDLKGILLGKGCTRGQQRYQLLKKF